MADETSSVQEGGLGEQQEQRKNEAKETLGKLRDLRVDLGVETMGPSVERAKEAGNPHPVAPEDRVPAPGPMQTRAADLAASHVSAAEGAISQQLEAQARIESDPRYERDQKIYEMGRLGKLGLVPPSEAEQAALLARSGLPPEVAEKLPKDANEQVEDDMERIEQAEERQEEINQQRASIIEAGQQEGAPKNNLQAMVDSGKKIGGAEGRKQSEIQAQKDEDTAKTATEGTIIK